MKKIKKIVVFTLLSLTLTFGACLITGCKLRKTNEKPSYVALQTKEYSMIIGEEVMLSMSYDLERGESFKYSSSNENVATVDENGKVLGVSCGTATITVTYGNASDTCEVTVGTGNILAYIDYNALNADEKIYVSLNDSLSVVPGVSFNGKTYNDATAEYILSDSSVGEIVDGVFTAKSLGETEIYVSALWRGISGESLTKTILVEVVNDFQIFLNNGSDSSFLLYTLDETKIPVTAGATENGTPVENVEMELVSGGETFVNYDGKTLQSKGIAGETELLVSCVDSQSKTHEKRFKITVTQTVLTLDETLTGFSAIDGEFVGNESFLTLLGNKVVKADDASGNPLTVTDGKVYGVETNKKGLTRTQITVYSNRVGYKINLEGYTGILDEAEDLKWFGVKNDGYKNHPLYPLNTGDRGYTYLAQRQDGYYVLGQNIDASDYVLPASGASLTTSISGIMGYVDGIGGIGLTGTFDGQGYTIRGLTTSNHGIFGIVYGGTVKNVAFTETKIGASNYGSTIAQWLINASIENVYVEVVSINENSSSSGVVCGAMAGSSFRGCIIEYDAETKSKTNYGSLTYLAYKEKGTSGYQLNVFNGAYVISSMECTVYSPSDPAKHYIVDAGNRSANYKFTGLKRYDTQADFETAGENFGIFNANYWDKSGATPVWKTKDFVPVEDEEEEKEDVAGVGSFNPDWIL